MLASAHGSELVTGQEFVARWSTTMIRRCIDISAGRCKCASQTVDGKNMAAETHGGEIQAGFNRRPKAHLP